MRWRAARENFAKPSALFALALALLVAGLLAPAGGLESLPIHAAFAPPSLAHPLGTDDLGRDMMLAIAQGTRTSMIVGFVASALALGCGLLVGVAAGAGPHWWRDVLMRTTDTVASLPTLLIAILVASLFGGSIVALSVVIGLTRWPVVARLVCGEVTSLQSRDFVRAAKALGLSPAIVLARHIMPHAATVALAATSVLFGGAIVAEASLAFIGLGDPSVTSLGQLAANGFSFLARAPWLWLSPVLAIAIAAALVAIIFDPASR